MQENFRSNNELAVEVCRFDLATHEGIVALANHVRTTWKIREIQMFRCFLHGGDFKSGAGWCVTGRSGINAPTAKADCELQDLWNLLIDDSQRVLGASLALHIGGTKLVRRRQTKEENAKHDHFYTTNDIDFGEREKILDKTLVELTREVGNKIDQVANRQTSYRKKVQKLEKENAKGQADLEKILQNLAQPKNSPS